MPGPAKTPALQVVREGNPAKRPVPEQVTVPPADFTEPDWSILFPEVKVPNEPNYPKRKDGDDEPEWAFDKRVELYHHRKVRWELKVSAHAASIFCRARAAEEWSRVVPVLKASVGLGNPDFSMVVDLCVTVARLEFCEHQISQDGLVTMGQRGPCRNPLTTIATQYRTQFKTYIRELGLSPSARTGVPARRGNDEDDDPFDD